MTEGFMLYAYESKREIEEILVMIESYKPVSAVERFFEDGEAADANAKAGSGLMNKVKGVIATVKKMISSAISTFTNWIQTMFMGKDEKNRFEEFKQKMASNPEFAGKKITVRNFRKIEEAHKQALKAVDKGLEEMKNATDEKAAEIEQRCKDTANNILAGIKSTAGVMVTKDAALRMCESNRDFAKWINFALENDSRAVEALEKELGSARAADFKKKVNSCTRRLSLHRFKVMLTGQYHKTTSGAINQVLQDIGDVASLKPGKVARQLGVVDDAIGSFNAKTGKNVTKTGLAKGAMQIRSEVAGAKRGAKKTADMVERKANEMKKSATRVGKFLSS